MDKLKVLEKIYYDISHPESFSTRLRLFKAARKINPNINQEFVDNWLMSQNTYTLFKKIKRRFPRLPYLVDSIDEQWQADLLDMTWFAQYNDNVRYLLVVIDLLSRYVWVRPLTSKHSKNVIEAFESIFNSSKRKPEKLQTDQGKELLNNDFKKYMKTKNINFFTTTDDVIKCGVVERFNRTLREIIYKYLHYKNSFRYIDSLQTIVDKYNKSYHRTIEMAPIDVNNKNFIKVIANIRKNRMSKPTKSTLKEGDYVRIGKKKHQFEKGATENWTPEIFKIQSKKQTKTRPIFKLEDWDGEPITSIHYKEELQKVNKPETFKIEKVLKTRKKGRKTEYFVKWLGWPDKFNSWVDHLKSI